MTDKIPAIVHYSGYSRELAIQSVGAGWEPLIHEVFDVLESIKGQVKIIQVKEKWGGLRIYTDYINEKVDIAIRNAERKSFTMCEVCGKEGKLRNCNGWYRTLCDVHGKGYPEVVNP